MAIQVLVLIEAKAGQREAVLEAFNRNAVTVRTEAGCLDYQAFVDAPGFRAPIAAFGPDTIVVLERWESIDDLNAHAKAPHTKSYRTETEAWVAKRTIHLLAAA